MPKGPEFGLPNNEYIERFDGSRWRIFTLPSGGRVVLTSRGNEILSYNPQLRHVLMEYKRDAQTRNENGLRKWFRAGGNSDVYTVGNTDLVVKEASTSHSVWSALDRMDYLQGIAVRHLPTYIRVPDHYGIVFPRNGGHFNRQYMLIQKVNEGLTVADLKNKDVKVDMPEWMKELALKEFETLEEKVQEAIDKATGRDFMPKNLLPDWDAGNVIVDLSTPRKEMPFTFWIIDQ